MPRKISRNELEEIGNILEKNEKCSNCNHETMESLVVTAFCLKTKKMESVVIRQCSYCLKLSSIASRAFGGC